ncbi:MAG: imidazolonepropionase [Prolixibacteraceae bacterium]
MEQLFMNNEQAKIFIAGPFSQLLTMDHLPMKGGLKDGQLEIVEEAGIVHQDGIILQIGMFKDLFDRYRSSNPEIQRIESDVVAIPGLVDPHTHLCWAGNRAKDYALRLQGVSYNEIAAQGGGIWDTVTRTRIASDEELKNGLISRASRQIRNGITTCEVKSGYALIPAGELRLLKLIKSVQKELPIDLVSTCLAAHIKPKDFYGSQEAYLQMLIEELLPQVKKGKLSNRIDIFVEERAFGIREAENYLKAAKSKGFDLVIHGDQFSSGGASLAVRVGARSVDHLEMIATEDISLLAASEVVAVALPGASIGLGCAFAPARKLLDAGCSLAIGSDWNPGSAPMGNLLVQTAILGTFEKLSIAEQFSAITFRAAHALNRTDRGILKKDYIADFIGFPGRDYREILYQQGMLKPVSVWKRGAQIL